jgi:radical SAM protein with 4Fe4S-binding SPASM domain
VKINVDQFVLDSKKSEWLWFWKRQHRFSYWKNRLEWYLYPKLYHVAKFPLHVDFEVSSLCNMDCPMCFRPHRRNQNDGLMDLNIFKKGIDECVKYNLYSIRLSWRGEPTTHPNLLDMVAYAKKRGVKEVSFLSNGLVIDEEYAKKLTQMRVDYISFSIDGLYEDYERIRKPATFEGILKSLKSLKEMRDSIGEGYPRIKVNTIWTKVKDQLDEYYKIFEPLADIISFNPDYDYTQETSKIAPNHICQYPWQRLTVKWNGDVPMCISDWDSEVILGNITKSTIFEIWNGDKMNQIRQDQQNHRIRNYAPCHKCHRPVTEQIGNIRPTKK